MTPRRFFRHVFKFHGFRQSFIVAVKGISYLFFYHRNMRIIFLFGIAAFLSGIAFKLKGIELIALCITISLVFVAEMFNTSIELIINMLTDKYHPLIKLVKDIAAAVVLIAALNAIVVGYILFAKRLCAFFTTSICFAEMSSASQIQRANELINQDAWLRDKLEHGQKVLVKKIIVEGVTLLTPRELKEITVIYQKHWLTKNEIQQILDLITLAYKKKGFDKQPANIAFTIEMGCLKIKVEELK